MSTGRREVCLDCDRWPCVCDLEMDEDEEEMGSCYNEPRPN
jgi:hypothetical protein